MLEALIISNILLWFAVLALLLVGLAMVRQIGVLFERVAPAGALMLVGNGPKVGDVAPQFDLMPLHGNSLHLGGHATKSVLLFFLSPTCPLCKTLLPALKSLAQAEVHWLDIVLASDGDTELQALMVEREDLGRFPLVLSTDLGMAYRVGKLPYAALIDEEGIIRSLGLVNSREHLESLIEAKERRIASIQEFLHSTAHEGENRIPTKDAGL